jgi:hypothetical protein
VEGMFYRTYLQESNETGSDNYEESQVTFHLHTEFYQISSFKVYFNVIAQYVENCVMGSVVIITIIIIITAIEFSFGGSSPYTSTGKTNTNKYT